MSEIIVISELDDAHVPFVQRHLTEELIVVDPFADPLTFVCGEPHNEVLSAGRSLRHVSSVWYRKPFTLLQSRVEWGVAEQHRRYARYAMGLHAELLHTSFRSAKWVSDYFAIARAESKALQLECARDFGMLVPETVMTSDAGVARAFLESHAATIIKPICSPVFAGGISESLLARRVHGPAGVEAELPGLRWAPAIFQQAIDAVADAA